MATLTNEQIAEKAVLPSAHHIPESGLRIMALDKEMSSLVSKPPDRRPRSSRLTAKCCQLERHSGSFWGNGWFIPWPVWEEEATDSRLPASLLQSSIGLSPLSSPLH